MKKKKSSIDQFILVKVKIQNFLNNFIVFKKRFPFFIRLENLINSRFLFKKNFLIIKNLFRLENLVLKEK